MGFVCFISLCIYVYRNVWVYVCMSVSVLMYIYTCVLMRVEARGQTQPGHQVDVFLGLCGLFVGCWGCGFLYRLNGIGL